MTLYILLGFFVSTTLVFAWLWIDRQLKLRRLFQLLKKRRSLATATPQGSFAAATITIKSTNPEDAILAKLKKAFEEDKVYVNPDLTLDSLAHELGTNKNTLSAIINKNLGKSFPELLGDYRVSEALRLFNDPKSDAYTIEAIGEMCGFKSRQVFHKNFRKRTGVPPKRLR